MKGKVMRSIIGMVSIIFIIWFMLPYFTHKIINIGNISGIALSALILFYMVAMPVVNGWVAKLWTYGLGRAIVSIAGAGVVVAIGVVIVASACMLGAAVKAPTKESTVIVLGCRVYGERASLMLMERLDAAYDYLMENESAVCILSGGKGSGENISEAECMYRYLVERGISKDRLYKEDQSTSTRENLLFSKAIMEEHGLSNDVAITTNEFHEYRAAKIAEALMLEPSAVSAKTAWWLFPTYYVRELYGVVYEWLAIGK